MEETYNKYLAAINGPKMDINPESLIKLFNHTKDRIKAFEKSSERTEAIRPFALAFQRYVEKGGDVNITSKNQEYLSQVPLWLACLIFIETKSKREMSLEKRSNEIGVMLDALNKLELSKNIWRGKSSTGLACFFGAWATADWLYRNDPNISNAPTPIFYDTVTKGSSKNDIKIAISMMEKFLDIGISPDKRSYWSNRSSLMRACGFSAIEQVQWLLEHGADPNATDNNGATPLVHALSPQFGIGNFTTRRRVGRTVEILMENNASIDFAPVTSDNFHSLLIACKSMDRESKDKLKILWKNECSRNKQLKSRKIPAGPFTLEGALSEDQKKKILYIINDCHHFDILFVCQLLGFILDNGINKFTFTDVATFFDEKWHGKDAGYFKQEFPLRRLEEMLGKIIIEYRARVPISIDNPVHLVRDFNTGFYAFVQNEEAGIVESQVSPDMNEDDGDHA